MAKTQTQNGQPANYNATAPTFTDGDPSAFNVDQAGNLKVNINDSTTTKSVQVDNLQRLMVESAKRIIGSGFGSSIDTTYLYNIVNAGTGTTTASTGEGILATGTGANGATTLTTQGKIRYLSGRTNLFRDIVRFGDTGTTNNVREFGIYIDANNKFVFRLSGTTFSCVIKRDGVETVVSNGSFNGNGTQSGVSVTVDTNYHSYEIMYTNSKVRFFMDDSAVHAFTPTTASLVSSMVGNLYASNVNVLGSTSNVSMNMLNWSGSQIGDSVNNPLFYCVNAVAETRTLKGGGGTLQAININRKGGANAILTVYDSTTGSGTLIGIWDLTVADCVTPWPQGVQGVNFYNGLTYVTSGTMTAGNITFFWE